MLAGYDPDVLACWNKGKLIMKKNAGFTLIELVIVIIVLGILAATAVPKFINLQDDAKESALKGAEAAIHSAANIVYSKAAIDGKENKATETITVDGDDIAIVNGYPAASTGGIMNAIELTGFASAAGTTAGSIVFWQGTGTTAPDNCKVTYAQAATSAATYTVTPDYSCGS